MEDVVKCIDARLDEHQENISRISTSVEDCEVTIGKQDVRIDHLEEGLNDVKAHLDLQDETTDNRFNELSDKIDSIQVNNVQAESNTRNALLTKQNAFYVSLILALISLIGYLLYNSINIAHI
jgi:chromosome segregation ATPase